MARKPRLSEDERAVRRRAAYRKYNNKPQAKARNAEYRRKHRVRLAAHTKAWRERPEVKERQKQYRATEAYTSWRTAYHRSYHLAKTYGLTAEQFEALQVAQGRKCAICGTDEPGGNGDCFRVDHDHATGEVRGLLCHACNLMLGYAKDNVAVLAAAIRYLSGEA